MGVSPTKIARSQLAAHYPRTRLFEVLDQAHDRPAVWVCGPPGVG